eukprot:8896984-Lingulodinium_polyedra.AAC.1
MHAYETKQAAFARQTVSRVPCATPGRRRYSKGDERIQGVWEFRAGENPQCVGAVGNWRAA